MISHGGTHLVETNSETRLEEDGDSDDTIMRNIVTVTLGSYYEVYPS